MTLSTLALIKSIDSVLASKGFEDSVGACNTFVEEVMSGDVQVPGILNGWCGMDSRFCPTLVFISVDHVKGKTADIPSFKKAVVSAVLNEIYALYSKACGEQKFRFVPCVRGLVTILKNRKSAACGMA
jgi:hypothetical protein